MQLIAVNQRLHEHRQWANLRPLEATRSLNAEEIARFPVGQAEALTRTVYDRPASQLAASTGVNPLPDVMLVTLARTRPGETIQ